MTTTQTDAEAYAQDDKMLLELLPNKKCYNSLTLCSNYLNKYDCTMSCYLNRVLEKPNTKFLYRLLHQYKYFARFLCPTLGSIYDEIPNKIRAGIKRNRLSSFLKAIGISAKPEDRDLDFIKNAPTALFNNLVKFGNGTEFGIIKPIIDAAEASVLAEMSGKGLSRMRYSNPVCRGVDQKSWVFSMVNTLTKHPHVSDMFLKGYWTTSRALSNGVPYPLDGLFTAWLTGMRVMAGAECSFISYAEQGMRFKCSQKAPIEEILEVFKKEAEIKKNPMNWMVCGAHQVRFPKWFKNKVRKNLKSGGVAGRSDVGDDNEEEMTAMPEGDSDPGSDIEKVVSNPDEFYDDDNDT
ncbi:unnamed protein product [Orchesella dallaii]|uniref:Uncharacterized protein n=1 Tax=Orchesella dallaii TaxID=48710 RepID=A0ABP1QPH3_9HEXA